MAKSKNHTNHNQNRKQHRNGIRTPKKPRYESRLGCCPKFLRNLKRSRKNNLKPAAQIKRFEARKAAREVAAKK